jgi:hypothetical protein
VTSGSRTNGVGLVFTTLVGSTWSDLVVLQRLLDWADWADVVPVVVVVLGAGGCVGWWMMVDEFWIYTLSLWWSGGWIVVDRERVVLWIEILDRHDGWGDGSW